VDRIREYSALRITEEPCAFSLLSMKPLRLVPRLVHGGLVDRENLDKGITPFVRIKAPFTGA
jgi:hypothetical protein